jgi:phenylalanyl-tRNA synthetase beta chain
LDKHNQVLSVPPIINSEHSKISINTKNVFIEVTALSRPKAMTCLNTLIWSFSEYCQTPFEIEPVEIIHGEEKFCTPQIEKKKFIVRHERAGILVSAKLAAEQIVHYLKKTGLEEIPIEKDSYKILVPCWRGDVIH